MRPGGRRRGDVYKEFRVESLDISTLNSKLSTLSPNLVITDSKQMSPAQRAESYEFLTTCPDIIWAVGQCSPAEIDEMNILWASMLAMKRALDALPRRPEFVLVDGNRLPDGIVASSHRRGEVSAIADEGGLLPKNDDKVKSKKLPLPACGGTPPLRGGDATLELIPGRAVVKGDSRSLSIAAASIIAKETRDRIMRGLARQFPEYGWDKNAGYPTAAHLQAIEKYGINEHYRKTFSPVAKIIAKS